MVDITNADLEAMGLNEIEKRRFWEHSQQQYAITKFHSERQTLKLGFINAMNDLNDIINKDTRTNQEATTAIKREAQIIKGILQFIKNQVDI